MKLGRLAGLAWCLGVWVSGWARARPAGRLMLCRRQRRARPPPSLKQRSQRACAVVADGDLFLLNLRIFEACLPDQVPDVVLNVVSGIVEELERPGEFAVNVESRAVPLSGPFNVASFLPLADQFRLLAVL